MDFGKADDPAAVDWSLPVDPAITAHTLAGLRDREAGARPERRLLIGSTGWGQRGFVGVVYPRGTKPGAYLQAYGAQFDCIELNATFYRVPDRRQALKWYAAVPDDFRFCPKVNQGITQAAGLALDTSRTLDFAKAVQAFEHKLGPCFAQLPSTFGADQLDTLRVWLDAWPPQLRLAVELRHESWFGTSAGADAFAELAARELGAVITDVGGRRDAAHMSMTTDFAMLRWVGNVHTTDEPRMRAWLERLRAWYAGGLRTAYVFVHQPEEAPGATSAARFGELAARALEGLDVRLRYPRVVGGGSPGAEPRVRQSELF